MKIDKSLRITFSNVWVELVPLMFNFSSGYVVIFRVFVLTLVLTYHSRNNMLCTRETIFTEPVTTVQVGFNSRY